MLFSGGCGGVASAGRDGSRHGEGQQLQSMHKILYNEFQLKNAVTNYSICVISCYIYCECMESGLGAGGERSEFGTRNLGRSVMAAPGA